MASKKKVVSLSVVTAIVLVLVISLLIRLMEKQLAKSDRKK